MSGARTAAGRHVEYLAHEWSRMAVPFDHIVIVGQRDVTLEGLGSTTRVSFETFGRHLPSLAWEQTALPLRARTASALFCPSYTGPLVSTVPMVVANHGIYERIKDEFPTLQRLRSTPMHRQSARRATRVVANSQQTRADLVEFFRLDPEKVDVVYPAANERFFAAHADEAIRAQVQETLGGDAPYFIFVGKFSKRRNVPNLIEAFGELRRRRGLTHRLLLVGPNTMKLPLAELCSRHGVEGALVHVPHLDQDALALLYAGADVFVLPTTYEGISYTMFEAMASGTPVLTVDHPTIAEGQDGPLVVPTPSVADIVAGLERLIDDDDLRRAVGERGREQARRFSWTETARATIAVLDSVAGAADDSSAVPAVARGET